MDIYTIRKEMLENNKRLTDLNLRVTYYARVSTEKDAQIHSLSAQKYHFEKRIAENPNWTLVEGYVDEGISATSVKNRENFLRMIKDAKKHRFDLIITKEISRFARNTVDSLSFTQDLLRHGVGVYFENDNLNTLEPDSELRLTIMSGMAQDESRKISERVSFGFRKSIERGVVLGNDCIWGYRKENGRLVIAPEEAEMVRKIFDLYANGNLGIRAIAKALTEMGYRNTNGNDFSFSSIKGILVNPKYKGFYCGNKTHKIDFRHDDIKHLPKDEWVMYEDHEKVPPIVSAELWEKANRKLQERSQKMMTEDKTSYQNKYLYSGKLVCGEHNTCYHHTIYKYKSGNKELWACKEYGNGNKCRNPLVYTTEIDAVVREVCNKVICEKASIINDLIAIYNESSSIKAIAKSKHKIQADIKALLAKKDKLLDLVMDDRLSNEEFEQRNNIFNVQIDEHRESLNKLDEEERKSLDLKESIESLRENIANELDFTEDLSKNVVDSFIDKIMVYKREENQIELKIFMKILPDALHRFTENSNLLTFGSGQIIQTRGGNSRSRKAYDLALKYDICYQIK
ncbi:MAG: recombinase family protein [Eubacteriales bacterium]|nr:recombinase family protein [Eubacteriales bacterium]